MISFFGEPQVPEGDGGGSDIEEAPEVCVEIQEASEEKIVIENDRKTQKKAKKQNIYHYDINKPDIKRSIQNVIKIKSKDIINWFGKN